MSLAVKSSMLLWTRHSGLLAITGVLSSFAPYVEGNYNNASSRFFGSREKSEARSHCPDLAEQRAPDLPFPLGRAYHGPCGVSPVLGTNPGFSFSSGSPNSVDLRYRQELAWFRQSSPLTSLEKEMSQSRYRCLRLRSTFRKL